MAVICFILLAVTITTLLAVIIPAVSGQHAPWAGLIGTVMGGLGVWYTFGLARDEFRAKQVRRARGRPEPGSR